MNFYKIADKSEKGNARRSYLLDLLLNKLLLQFPDFGKFFQSRLPYKIIVAGPQNLKISLRSLLSNRST